MPPHKDTSTWLKLILAKQEAENETRRFQISTAQEVEESCLQDLYSPCSHCLIRSKMRVCWATFSNINFFQRKVNINVKNNQTYFVKS